MFELCTLLCVVFLAYVCIFASLFCLLFYTYFQMQLWAHFYNHLFTHFHTFNACMVGATTNNFLRGVFKSKHLTVHRLTLKCSQTVELVTNISICRYTDIFIYLVCMLVMQMTVFMFKSTLCQSRWIPR